MVAGIFGCRDRGTQARLKVLGTFSLGFCEVDHPYQSSVDGAGGRDSCRVPMRMAAMIYLAFVVYGSLVPLEFHRRDLLEAWHAFREMPYLKLGADARADWIANLLLYIPLAFLVQESFAGASKSRFVQAMVAAGTLAACLTLAMAVEFVQLFFPPRTVSTNDLIAEALGSVVGLLIWALWGGALIRAIVAMISGGPASRRAVLWLYLLAYLLLSLYPFDFIVSSSELSAKFATGRVGWIIAQDSGCGSVTTCTLKTLVEILGFVPFGLLLASRAQPRRGELGRSFALGIAVGLAIEFIQIFVGSGISQGLSVLARGVGAVVGCALYRLLQVRKYRLDPALTRLLVALAAPLYLVGLCYVAGWLSFQWQDRGYALHRVAEINWLPFYYHYYTTETRALVSLLLSAALYGMIGVAAWLWSPSNSRFLHTWTVAAIAGAIAFVVEAGKLYLPPAHPDPTNVLIAAVAAAMALGLCRILASPFPAQRSDSSIDRTSAGPQVGVGSKGTPDFLDVTTAPAKSILIPEHHEGGSDPPPPARSHERAGASLAMRLTQIALLCVTGYSILDYPFAVPLALFIAAYLLLLYWYPHFWQIVVLAALPVVDFAQWSGRILWDEFDILLLATVAMVVPRLDFSGTASHRNFWKLMTAVALGYIVSFGVGVFPLSPVDANAFNNYYSHYAGLRIIKGMAWAIALLLLISGDQRPASGKMRSIAWGMAIGLALETAFVCWERLSFSGVLNFADDYRVTGTFSTMHTGGAYIEAYLVAAIPFVAYLAISTRSAVARAGLIAVLLGAMYALLVTYSRGGYAALALAGIVFVLGALVGPALLFDRLRRFLSFALIIAVAGLVAIPIWGGPYMKDRFAKISTDFGVRSSHWSDSLAFRDPGVLNRLFGMGLGTYPEAYFWKHNDGATPATYRFVTEGGNTALRLTGGDSLYFEQLVPIEPNTDYELTFDARPVAGLAALTVPICEKWMLYSFRCEWNGFRVGGGGSDWRHFTFRFNSKELGSGGRFVRRTVKLSLFESEPNSVLDVDNVRLVSEGSRDLIRNGGFNHAMDHWFFTTDNHLPWHVKNLWVHLLFEQGWVGVATVGLLTLATICVLGAAMVAGEYFATVLLASVLALLCVGMVDSLVDAPRHVLLFMFIIGLGWLLVREGKQLADPAASSRN